MISITVNDADTDLETELISAVQATVYTLSEYNFPLSFTIFLLSLQKSKDMSVIGCSFSL